MQDGNVVLGRYTAHCIHSWDNKQGDTVNIETNVTDYISIKFVKESDVDIEREVMEDLDDYPAPDNHIVRPLQEIVFDSGTLFVVQARTFMDYVEDTSLHTASLVDTIISLSHQLVEGILFMHTKKWVHMNINPLALMVDSSGDLIIHNFKFLGEIGSPNMTWEEWEHYPGVPEPKEKYKAHYRAPEVTWKRFKPTLADTWSCGEIIHTLCKLMTVPSSD